MAQQAGSVRLVVCFVLATVPRLAASTASGDIPKTSHEDWHEAMDTALAQEEKGYFSEAERVLLASIRKAGQQADADPEWLPSALIRLGGLNRLIGREGQAEALYRKSAGLWRSRFGQSSLGLSLALSDLAWLYVARGEPRRAEPLWQRSLQIRVSKLGPVHPSVARIYGYMAVGAFADNRQSDAELDCRQALDVYAQSGEIAGETDPVLNSLASIRLRQGNIKEAMQLAQRAISLQHFAERPSPRLLSGYLYNLARAEGAAGQSLAADEHFRNALSLAANPPLDESALHCRILKSYAVFLRNTGRKKESKAPRQLAGKIEKKAGRLQSQDTLVALSDLR